MAYPMRGIADLMFWVAPQLVVNGKPIGYSVFGAGLTKNANTRAHRLIVRNLRRLNLGNNFATEASALALLERLE